MAKKKVINRYANDPLIKEMYGDNPINPLDGIRLSDIYNNEEAFAKDVPVTRLQGLYSTQDYPSPFRVAFERGSIGNVVTEGVPQDSDWGESRYDEQFITDDELARYQQNRFEQQSALERLGLGVLKIVPRALTLIPETIGMAWAGGEALLTDKTFAEAMREQFESNPGFQIDDAVNNALTIYKPEDYDERNLWQRMGTSSFWSDGIIANFGFQLGSGLIFKGIQKGVTKALVKATEKAVLNGNKLARGVQVGVPMLTAGYVSSVGEAGVEARSYYNDLMEEWSNDYKENTLQPQFEMIDAQYSNEPEIAYNLKQGVLNEYYRVMGDYAKIASEEARKVYNYNKAVLGVSNLLQFSTLFKSGFNGNLSDINTYITKGQLKQLAPKAGVLPFAKNVVIEGGEEGMQHIGQDVGQIQAKKYQQDYINNAYNLDNLEMTSSFMSDFGKAFAENMSDTDFWEEVVAGAIMGGIMPHPRLNKGQKGKRKIEFDGGIKELWTTKKRYNENQAKIDKLNEQLSNYDNMTILKAANVVFASQQRQQQAEYDGNKKDFEDENVIQAATLIASLSEIGRGDMVLDRLKELKEHYSKPENREKLATTDVSQGGLSQKGSDGSELNEYAKLATDEERKKWLDDRFDKAAQMVKDMNTISYNIRRILPSDISSQDLLPLVIDRYRLYESEDRMQKILEDLYVNADYYASVTGNPQVAEDIKTWYSKNKESFDTHTLIEGQKRLSSRATAAKNLINLANRLSKDLTNRPNVYRDIMELLSYLGDYIDLNNKVVSNLNKPEAIQHAREEAEENLSKKQKEKSFDIFGKDFAQGDDAVKYDMYNRASDEEKRWLEKNAGKKNSGYTQEDIDFIKEKNKLKKGIEDGLAKVNHAAITPQIKAEALSEALAVINGMDRNAIKNLDNVLSSIQNRRGQDLYKDYALEQALNNMRSANAFKDRFKTFVPIITKEQVNFQFAVEAPVGNDVESSGTPTVMPKGDNKVTIDNSYNPSSEDLNTGEQPQVDRPKSEGDNKNYIYPEITEEDRNGKYNMNHKPSWEIYIAEELMKVFKDQAKVDEYIANLKKTPWQTITAESIDPKNIENGTYRGYYDIWTYLNEHNAFEYVNLGNVKKGDEVTFSMDKKLSDDVIFITTKQGQIIGVLPQTGITGIKELRERIKSDLAKGTTTVTTNVTKIMNGVVQYTDTDQSLATIGNKTTKLAILGNDGFKGNGIEDLQIETWSKNIEKYTGAVFALIPTSRGTYFPVLLHTAKDFDNFNTDNAVNNSIKETVQKLTTVKNADEFNKVVGKLRQLLYLEDTRINMYTSVTNDQNETHYSEITDTQNVGSPIAAIGFTSRTADAEQAEQFKETGSSKSNIVYVRLDDEQALPKMLNEIANRAVRYNVVSSLINEGEYNENLFKSGILSTNVLQLNNLTSSWFTLPYYDAKTGKFSETVETPTGQKGSRTQPINGKDSISFEVTFNTQLQGIIMPCRIAVINNVTKYYIDNTEIKDNALITFLRDIGAFKLIFDNPNKTQDINYVSNNNGEFYFRNNRLYKFQNGVFSTPSDEEVKQVMSVLQDRYDKRQKQSVVAIPVESDRKPVGNSLAETYTGEFTEDRTNVVDDALKAKGVTSTTKPIEFPIFDQKIANSFVPIYYAAAKTDDIIKTKGIYWEKYNVYVIPEIVGEGDQRALYARFVFPSGKTWRSGNREHMILQLRRAKTITPYTKETFISRIEERIANLKTYLDAIENNPEKKSLQSKVETKPQESKISIKPEVQKVIDTIVNESKRFTLTENGQYYKDNVTGKLYARVTSVISTDEETEKFDQNSPWLLPSTTIGTTVDEFIRDFFAGTLKDSYPNATKEQWDAFKKQLETTKKALDDRGMIIIPRDVTVEGMVKLPNNKTLPVAGTLDLLCYDTKTDEFVIIDIKSVHNPDNNQSKMHKWGLQTSLYQDLLEAKYGIKVRSRHILPVHVHYPDATSHNYTANGLQLSVNGDIFEDAAPELLPSIGVEKISGRFDTEKLTDSEKTLLESSVQEAPNTAEYDTSNNDDDVDAALNMPLERAATDNKFVTPADIEKELKWLEKALPNVSKEGRIELVNVLYSIDGRSLYGKFEKGVMTILKYGPKGTTYHEAFHLVSNCILTLEEQNDVYKAARQKWGNLKNRDIEEKLADAFTNYMVDEEYYAKTLPIVLKRAFKKIASFFKSLFGINNPDKVLDKLFHDIHEGAYKDRVIHDSNRTFEREYTAEMQQIKDQAIANGTFMKAPNGKPTNLNERQWLQVRTKAFKDWFGDWERIAKLDAGINAEGITNKEYAFNGVDFIENLENNIIWKGLYEGLKEKFKNNELSAIKFYYADFNSDLPGIYGHDNIIYLNRKTTDFSNQLHEFIHAITAIEYHNNEEFKREVDDLYNTAINHYRYGKDNLKNHPFYSHHLYGYTSPTEFLAEALANHEFRDILSRIPYKNKKSVWQRFIDLLKKHFFVRDVNDTVFQGVINSIFEYSKVNKSIRENVSKVVDENGEPLVVYHHTNNPNLTEFSTDFNNYFAKDGGTKEAIFFDENETGTLNRKYDIPVFLNIKDLHEYNETKEQLHQRGTTYRQVVNESASKNNIDGGVHMKDFDDNKMEHQSIWIIHNPNQAKSAIDNIGTFSREDNNIYYRENSILQQIQLTAGINPYDFINQTFDRAQLTDYIIPKLERGAKKLGRTVYVSYSGDEYNTKVDLIVTNKDGSIFDRKATLSYQREQVFGREESPEEVGRNRLDYEYLSSTEQNVVDQYVGYQIWNEMDKSQRENILNCR